MQPQRKIVKPAVVAKKPAPPAPARPVQTKPIPQAIIEQEKKIMSSPEQHPDQSPAQVLRGTAGNVDKIRDILFGTQMRDYESRFARLEETLIKETLEIRETGRRRHEQLESYIRKEFEAVQARIKTERDERTDNAAALSRELKELGDTLARRIRDLDDRGNNVERELRNDLLQQARDLTEEIRARHEELSSLLEKRVHELRDGKTDRATLASLFTEVALRLSDQFQIPGSEA
jgi:phage host-nuclease inhibitor protein Gam